MIYLSQHISYLFFNVTNSCNLKCSFCGANAGVQNNQELMLPEIKVLLESAHSLGADKILIGGGEPFMRNDIFEILQCCQDLGIFATVETNATLITPQIAHRLQKMGISSFSVSIDGANAGTHDKLRGVNGSFHKAIKGIDELVKANLQVTIQCLVCNSNYLEILEIRKIAHTFNTFFRVLPRIISIGRGKVATSEIVDVNRLNVLLKKLFEIEEVDPSSGFDVGAGPALIPIKFLNRIRLCNLSESCGITSDGYVSICPLVSDFPELRMGNIRKENLSEILSNSKLHQFIKEYQANDLKGVCKICLTNQTCRGGCRIDAYSVYNDLLAPDPLCQQFYEKGLFPKYALRDH